MASKQKILIVDDDENIAELISLYLVKECFETILKEHGKIDVLINNAGISENKVFTDGDPAIGDCSIILIKNLIKARKK